MAKKINFKRNSEKPNLDDLAAASDFDMEEYEKECDRIGGDLLHLMSQAMKKNETVGKKLSYEKLPGRHADPWYPQNAAGPTAFSIIWGNRMLNRGTRSLFRREASGEGGAFKAEI